MQKSESDVCSSTDIGFKMVGRIVDGQTLGRTVRRSDGRSGRQSDRPFDGRLDGRSDGGTIARTDARTIGRTDGRMDRPTGATCRQAGISLQTATVRQAA